MTAKTDGGPAFPGKRPFKYYSMGEHKGVETVPGMSLRDYFAAKAMQGAFTSPLASSEEEKQYIAMHAYRMADAMLAARENKS